MKLYLITRSDDADYDEYVALVVRAESDEAACQFVLTARETLGAWVGLKYPGITAGNIVVQELTAEGEPGEVIRDFKAG